MLYAKALDKLINDEKTSLAPRSIDEIASNGTEIIKTIIDFKNYSSKYIYMLYIQFARPNYIYDFKNKKEEICKWILYDYFICSNNFIELSSCYNTYFIAIRFRKHFI